MDVSGNLLNAMQFYGNGTTLTADFGSNPIISGAITSSGLLGVTVASGYAATFMGGNVGIGTTTPLSKLSINGGLHVGGDSDAGDNNLLVDGNVTLGTAGSGISIKEGSNATMGIATLVAGTVTVNTTKVTANSRIFLTVNGGTLTNVGATYISARTAGTSFTITSMNILDASDVSWFICEPN
jgi:hypothetical protein